MGPCRSSSAWCQNVEGGSVDVSQQQGAPRAEHFERREPNATFRLLNILVKSYSIMVWNHKGSFWKANSHYKMYFISCNLFCFKS